MPIKLCACPYVQNKYIHGNGSVYVNEKKVRKQNFIWFLSAQLTPYLREKVFDQNSVYGI